MKDACGGHPRARVITAPSRPVGRGPGPCTWRPSGGGAEAGRPWHRLQPARLDQIRGAPSQGGGRGDWMCVRVARCGAHVRLRAGDSWAQNWRKKDFWGRMLVQTRKWGCLCTRTGKCVWNPRVCKLAWRYVCARTREHACMVPRVKNTGLFVCRPQSMWICDVPVGAARDRAGCG